MEEHKLMLISNSYVRLLLGINNESLKSSQSASLSYIYYSVSSMTIRNKKRYLTGTKLDFWVNSES